GSVRWHTSRGVDLRGGPTQREWQNRAGRRHHNSARQAQRSGCGGLLHCPQIQRPGVDMTIDTKRLRELAEAANQGEWTFHASSDARPHSIFMGGPASVEVHHYGYIDPEGITSRKMTANARHIAAA